MSQGSNIRSVSLDGAELTIIGTVDKNGHDIGLLHVWLAQPGACGNAGAGLAIDCNDNPSVTWKPNNEFTLIVRKGDSGVVGDFFHGPATASAIAVLTENGVVTEVLQWSLILTLSGAPVPLDAPAAGQGQST